MCGIAGILGLDAQGDQAEQLLRRQCVALRRRGPDDSGVWFDHAAGIGLAHTRLAILDLSNSGAQPMHSASGRYVIAFNGEIYNFRALRQALESGGYRQWRGHSDTEVLLAAIEVWGVERTLKKANGMFAFALWDTATESLVLGRDRFGEKPLYYGRIKQGWIFASELSALECIPGWQPEIDPEAVANLLRYSYIPAPQSIYQGIHKLKPGSFLRLSLQRGGECESSTFWCAQEEVLSAQADNSRYNDEATSTDALYDTLKQSVALRMESDVPLGALLSGGVDSSLVTALMQDCGAGTVRSFSIGFPGSELDESAHAAAVAKALGTLHTELQVTAADALNAVPQMSQVYSEPFGDSSQVPTHLVSVLTRQHVTVAMSGDGGDELFGGYNRYLALPAVSQRLQGLPQSLRRLLGSGVAALPAERAAQLNNVLRHLQGKQAIGNFAFKWQKLARALQAPDERSAYQSAVIVGHGVEALLQHAAPPRNVEFLDELSFVENMMLADTQAYLPEDILVKVDRASMFSSLETRTPFLDPDVFRFAWQLPAESRIDGATGKVILKQLLYRFVDQALIDRPKAGFAIPINDWLRGPLKEWADALMKQPLDNLEACLRPTAVRQCWQRFRDSGQGDPFLLWNVLMLLAWADARGAQQ